MVDIIALSEPQNHRCCYCGHHMIRHHQQRSRAAPLNAATRDHLTPRTHGGRNIDNLVAACLQCNNLRGDMEALAFFNLLRKMFKRDQTLRNRWYLLPQPELKELKLKCIATQERQLRGLARSSVEHAFRHRDLLWQHGHKLRV